MLERLARAKNTLAYSSSSSVARRKMFYDVDTWNLFA
jgi:hypothetical protein